MKNDFLPTNDDGFLKWFNTFVVKLKTYQTKFNISEADYSYFTAALLLLQYITKQLAAQKAYQSALVNFKATLRKGSKGEPGIELPNVPEAEKTVPAVVANELDARIRRIAKAIKSHSNYTEAIGIDLGIVGSDKVVKLADLMPVLVLNLEGGHVVVTYGKEGMDGLDLYIDRVGDGKYEAPKTVLKRTYTDQTPLPTQLQKWSYYGIFRKGDEQVGQPSAVVSIAVGG